MLAYALTDIGRFRTHNQDYLYASSGPVGEFPNLFLVADGMGGHQAGDFASHFVVEHLVSFLKRQHGRQIIPALREGIERVNAALYAKAIGDKALTGMGTTLVAAAIEGRTLYVANVGDSRLYLYRGGRLLQITRDHSYVEELVALGKMERGSQDYLNKKNIITRAVGAEAKVEVDFFEESLSFGDLILLCSDGLYNMLSEREFLNRLKCASPLKEKVERLIDEANANGGRDNIAVVLVDPQIREVKAC